jgi:CTP:molybdopterin cytidylyltransferase MocA
MDTTTKATRYIGVVLAGGLSSRMGRDKALLLWQGRPLIERQIAVLHEAGVDSVHISGERPDYQGVADSVAHVRGRRAVDCSGRHATLAVNTAAASARCTTHGMCAFYRSRITHALATG